MSKSPNSSEISTLSEAQQEELANLQYLIKKRAAIKLDNSTAEETIADPKRGEFYQIKGYTTALNNSIVCELKTDGTVSYRETGRPLLAEETTFSIKAPANENQEFSNILRGLALIKQIEEEKKITTTDNSSKTTINIANTNISFSPKTISITTENKVVNPKEKDYSETVKNVRETLNLPALEASPVNISDAENLQAQDINEEEKQELLKNSELLYKRACDEIIKLSTKEVRAASFAKALGSLDKYDFLTSEELKKLADEDSIFKTFYELSKKSLEGKNKDEKEAIIPSLKKLLGEKFQNTEIEVEPKKTPAEFIKFADIDENTDKSQVASLILSFLNNHEDTKELDKEIVNSHFKSFQFELGKAVAAEQDKLSQEEKAVNTTAPTATTKSAKEEKSEEGHKSPVMESAKAIGAAGTVTALAIVAGPIAAIVVAGALMWWYSKKNADKREEREARHEEREEAEFHRFLEREGENLREQKASQQNMGQKDALAEMMAEEGVLESLNNGVAKNNDAENELEGDQQGGSTIATGDFIRSLTVNESLVDGTKEEISKTAEALQGAEEVNHEGDTQGNDGYFEVDAEVEVTDTEKYPETVPVETGGEAAAGAGKNFTERLLARGSSAQPSRQ